MVDSSDLRHFEIDDKYTRRLLNTFPNHPDYFEEKNTFPKVPAANKNTARITSKIPQILTVKSRKQAQQSCSFVLESLSLR